MGLDVAHLKLLMIPIDQNDYLLTDTWDIDCNVPLIVYSKFLTSIKFETQSGFDLRPGFFFEEVGYQRKWMDDGFYSDFENNFLLGTFKDFEQAYKYVGGKDYLDSFGREQVEQVKEAFRINFLENFVWGQSLLCISW